MATYTVLFNRLAGNGRGEERSRNLQELLKDDVLHFVDISKIESYEALLAGLPEGENIIICGGDGTLNRFVNDIADLSPDRDIYYYAAGSGNDFRHDLGREDEPIVKINEYLVDLPIVTVKGKSYRVLNGMGYGIDGYCCQVGDEQRAAGNKEINYTAIAIKGLLFHYKPTDATVIVDGVEHRFKKAWLAPTMNGRFYGGGMMACPDQDRLNKDGTLSTLVMYGKGKIRTLMVFPSIFKGEHVKHTEMTQVLTGKEIAVRFDRPVAAQIDGETVLDVTEYTMRSVR